ncbi:hypothetical protein K438DRAFT_1977801 [Mycena galopus ATCC 62051]|nr:hypothetical protein K438DRAFT_1977801 [Mycena galopus ATCC 62051]
MSKKYSVVNDFLLFWEVLCGPGNRNLDATNMSEEKDDARLAPKARESSPLLPNSQSLPSEEGARIRLAETRQSRRVSFKIFCINLGLGVLFVIGNQLLDFSARNDTHSVLQFAHKPSTPWTKRNP